MHLKM